MMTDSRNMNDIAVWYIAQLKPNSHRIAEINLTRQGFSVFCPMAMETKRVKGRFIKAAAPLFPGYLFVKHEQMLGSWGPINSTRGVTRLVAFDEKGPCQVPADLIEDLQCRFHPDREVSTIEFKPGQEVRLGDGPFTNFLATIEKVASKDRIWLLLDVLGKQTRVKVGRHQLSA